MSGSFRVVEDDPLTFDGSILSDFNVDEQGTSFALSDTFASNQSILRITPSEVPAHKIVSFVEATIVPGALETSRRLPRRITKEEKDETINREQEEEQEFAARCEMERLFVERSCMLVLNKIVAQEHDEHIDVIFAEVKGPAKNEVGGLSLIDVESEESQSRLGLVHAEHDLFFGVVGPSYITTPLEQLHREELLQLEVRQREMDAVMWNCSLVEDQQRARVADLEFRLRSLLEQREVERRPIVARQTAASEIVTEVLRPWSNANADTIPVDEEEEELELTNLAKSSSTDRTSTVTADGRSRSPSECGGPNRSRNSFSLEGGGSEDGALVELEETAMRDQIYEVLFNGVDITTVWGERIVPTHLERWSDIIEHHLQLPKDAITYMEPIPRKSIEQQQECEFTFIQHGAKVEREAVLTRMARPTTPSIRADDKEQDEKWAAEDEEHEDEFVMDEEEEEALEDASNYTPPVSLSANQRQLSSSTTTEEREDIPPPPWAAILNIQEDDARNGVTHMESRHFIVFGRDFRLEANEAREAASKREEATKKANENAAHNQMDSYDGDDGGVFQDPMDKSGANTNNSTYQPIEESTASPLSPEELNALRLVVKGNLIPAFGGKGWIATSLLLDGVWSMHTTGSNLSRGGTNNDVQFGTTLQVLAVLLSQKVALLCDNWARHTSLTDLNNEGITLPIGEVVMVVLASLRTFGGGVLEDVDRIAASLADGITEAERIHRHFPFALNVFNLLDVGRSRLVHPQVIQNVLGILDRDTPHPPLVPLCVFADFIAHTSTPGSEVDCVPQWRISPTAVSQCIERSLINAMLLRHLDAMALFEWRTHLSSMRHRVRSASLGLHSALVRSNPTSSPTPGAPLKRWLVSQSQLLPSSSKAGDVITVLKALGVLEATFYSMFEEVLSKAFSHNLALSLRYGDATIKSRKSFSSRTAEEDAYVATPLLGDVLYSATWMSFLSEMGGDGDALYSDSTGDIGWVAIPRRAVEAITELKIPSAMCMSAPFSVSSVIVALREMLVSVAALTDALSISIVGTRDRRGRSYTGLDRVRVNKPVAPPAPKGFTHMMTLLDAASTVGDAAKDTSSP